MVYAGRFVAGLGVGQTLVVGPVYIAEIAPASIRGLCTCIFTRFVYLGIVLAYFTNYGAQIQIGDTSHARWVFSAPILLPSSKTSLTSSLASLPRLACTLFSPR